MIQKAIRNYFSSATVIGPLDCFSVRLKNFTSCVDLAIAHRLHTIADYSRILVMENGELKEWGTPLELATKHGSHFKALIESTGKTEAAVLMEMMGAGQSERKEKKLIKYASTDIHEDSSSSTVSSSPSESSSSRRRSDQRKSGEETVEMSEKRAEEGFDSEQAAVSYEYQSEDF